MKKNYQPNLIFSSNPIWSKNITEDSNEEAENEIKMCHEVMTVAV